MKRVLANGTFDLIHPGHIHYLEESARYGEELYVVIARDTRAQEKKEHLLFDEDQRKQLVEALDPVDKAVLGSKGSIFDTVEEYDPDVITLGHDQEFDRDELITQLRNHGSDADVVRIEEGPAFSSHHLKDRLQD